MAVTAKTKQPRAVACKKDALEFLVSGGGGGGGAGAKPTKSPPQHTGGDRKVSMYVCMYAKDGNGRTY